MDRKSTYTAALYSRKKGFVQSTPILSNLLVVGLLFSSYLACNATAANHYILDGGTGDGSAWNDAWDNLPATLVRGDTYYIGDGEYGKAAGYNFNDAESGTALITIKKAIAADHGTETGWNAAYGDGQAVWTMGTGGSATPAWGFPNDYYVIDGQTGGGPGSWTTGHGFKVLMVDVPAPAVGGTRWAISLGSTGFGYATVGDHITFSHVEVQGPGTGYTGLTSHRIFTGSYSGTLSTFQGPDSMTVDHCYFHDIMGMPYSMVYPSNLTWEYNATVNQESRWGPTEAHTTCLQFHGSREDIIIRYNLFENCGGTAAVDLKRNFDVYDTGTIAVYGNVFYSTDAWLADTVNHVGFGEGIVSMCVNTVTGGWSDNPVNALYFYNNTMIRVNGITKYASGLHVPHVETCVVANNIWMDCTNLDGTAGNIGFNYHDHPFTVDYNQYINTVNPSLAEPYTATGFISAGANDLLHQTTNPFTDYAALDFSLTAKSARQGMTLSAPYTKDWDGSTRGSDGWWDIGAIEYDARYANINSDGRENWLSLVELRPYDLAGHSVTFAPQVIGLPKRASFDPATNLLSWQPWYNQAGSYELLFSAVGGDYTQKVAIDIEDVLLKTWYEDWINFPDTKSAMIEY